MSRQHIKLAVRLGALALSIFFGGAAPFAFAQTGFVLASQGVISAQDNQTTTSGFGNGAGQFWDMNLGDNLVGTTTSVAIGLVGTILSTASINDIGFVQLAAFSDSSYSTQVGICYWDSAGVSSGYYDTGFIQLTHTQSVSGTGCVMSSSLFYKLNIFIEYKDITTGISLLGSDSYYTGSPVTVPQAVVLATATPTTVVVPYFALIGDNFQITPTASSSGLFLSGAQSFCAASFASSTAPGVVTDLGIAVCDVGGYLFVPTSDSLSQFENLNTGLSQKAPFSWVFGTVGTWQSLQASSSQNLPDYSIDLSQIDFSSSTAMGSLLPANLDLLSTTTINKYLPSGVYDSLYALAGFAISLEAVYFIFSRAKVVL